MSDDFWQWFAIGYLFAWQASGYFSLREYRRANTRVLEAMYERLGWKR